MFHFSPPLWNSPALIHRFLISWKSPEDKLPLPPIDAPGDELSILTIERKRVLRNRLSVAFSFAVELSVHIHKSLANVVLAIDLYHYLRAACRAPLFFDRTYQPSYYLPRLVPWLCSVSRAPSGDRLAGKIV